MGDQVEGRANSTGVDGGSHSEPMRDSDQFSPILNLNELNSEGDNSIVNVTREYPSEYATIMFGYIMPLVLIVTLITNTLVVMVLAKKHMRTPTNIVLFTMAIVDLMTLVFPAPWYFYIYTLGFHDKFLYPPIYCYAHHIMTDVFPIFFHTSSIWLALLLAGQRYIYVCHPTIASTWCTVRRVRKAIKFILFTALLHQSTKFFDNTFSAVKVRDGQSVHMACKIEVASWVGTYFGLPQYYITYFTFRILFVFIIPCVALITLNCLLFRALRKAEDKRTKLLGTRFKTLSGKRGSTAGVLHQFSSLHENRFSSTVEVTSAVQPIARDSISSAPIRPPSPILERADVEGTQSPDELNNYRRESLLSARGGQVRSTKNSCLLTSDSKLSCQTLEEQVPMSVLFNRRPQFESQRSQESNKSCPVTSILSKTERTGCGENSTSSCRQSKKIRNNLRSAGASRYGRDKGAQNQEEDEDEGCVQSEKEDDLTCPFCFASCDYNVESDCLRCSRLARDGATSDRRGHLCQAFSQCSSITGGATNNTTTLEDGSGSAVMPLMNNTCSSALAVNDGSIQVDSGLLIRANGHNGDELGTAVLSNRDYIQLLKRSSSPLSSRKKVRKSGSVDSRLACGCPPGANRSAPMCIWRKSNCADCCATAGTGRNRATRRSINHTSCVAATITALQTTKVPLTASAAAAAVAATTTTAATKAPHKQIKQATCSCSEPCINCHNTRSKRGSGDSALKQAAIAKATAESQVSSKKDQQPQEQVLTTSRSDYAANADAGSSMRKHVPVCANVKVSNTAIATATASTTATTTLQSTNANSECSLLQVIAQSSGSSQQQQQPLLLRKEGYHHPQHQVVQQKKSHSIIGVPFRGRGSSNPNAVPEGAGGRGGGSSSATVATMKSMDSNRTTLMLIVVVSVFLLVEVPVAVTTILHVVLNTFDAFQDVELTHQLNYIKLFTNFFIMLSYSVNFSIYCSMSKKFRETFKDLFVFGKRARDQRLRQLLNEQQQHYQHTTHNSQYNKHAFEQQSMEVPVRPALPAVPAAAAAPVGAVGSAPASAAAATVAAAVGAPTVVPLECVAATAASASSSSASARNRNLLRCNQNRSAAAAQQQQLHSPQQQECKL